MDLYAGTSGYSYKEWKGTFYPKDLPAKQMLRFYGEHFRTVEFNRTFNRMPSPSVLEGWADAVHADFKFVLKAPRQITHQRRLKDAAELSWPRKFHCSRDTVQDAGFQHQRTAHLSINISLLDKTGVRSNNSACVTQISRTVSAENRHPRWRVR
jgi:uncharacterized protein YecE (DUF72 family)